MSGASHSVSLGEPDGRNAAQQNLNSASVVTLLGLHLVYWLGLAWVVSYIKRAHVVYLATNCLWIFQSRGVIGWRMYVRMWSMFVHNQFESLTKSIHFALPQSYSDISIRDLTGDNRATGVT